MTRRRVYAALVAATVLVAALAGLLAWRAWDSPAGPVLGDEPIAGTALLEPEQHLFGDAVRARLELVMDRNRIDPDSVEVGANFQPYRELRPVERTRTNSGPITRLRYDYLIACLSAACLPSGGGRVEFGGAAIEFSRPGEPVPETASIEWPPLRAAGRIDPDRLGQAALRAELRDLSPPAYRVSPKAVELVALLFAVVFAAAAAILAIRFLPLDRIAAWLGAGRADLRTPLERALALVRDAVSAGRPTEGRRALERLAHELRATSNPELASDASRLAWSKRAPGEARVTPLSHDVERVIEGES
ncbi:MAG: hypothetical protein ACRDM9_05035 [Gaiellaceae bacterium]